LSLHAVSRKINLGEEVPVLTRDALLLIGHGSTGVPDAARALLSHAEVIRDSHRYAEVAVGMLLGKPDVTSAFDHLTAPVIHVVPFFLEDGYFTRIVIPDLLVPRASASRLIDFCPPVGSHDGVATVIETRLMRHCEAFGTDPISLSVLLVGHGSARNPGQARLSRWHAARLESSGRFGAVRAAYLEEAPFAAEILAGNRGHIVAVIGYLANHGAHATSDLPRLIAEERLSRGTHWPPVHNLGSIGDDAAMPRIIMELATTAR